MKESDSLRRCLHIKLSKLPMHLFGSATSLEHVMTDLMRKANARHRFGKRDLRIARLISGGDQSPEPMWLHCDLNSSWYLLSCKEGVEVM